MPSLIAKSGPATHQRPGPWPTRLERDDMDNILDRLRRDVTKPDGEDGCWLWTGSATQDGYGRFAWQGQRWYAHRVAYEAFVEPIPEGFYIDHLCRTPPCCNPAHLEAVTPSTNAVRADGHRWQINVAKTHCIHGHEFTPENTYNPPGRRRSSDGQATRNCIECKREATRRYRARRRNLAASTT